MRHEDGAPLARENSAATARRDLRFPLSGIAAQPRKCRVQPPGRGRRLRHRIGRGTRAADDRVGQAPLADPAARRDLRARTFHRDTRARSEEHTSELQSLMRISYAVFCLKKERETIRRHIDTQLWIFAVVYHLRYTNL